VRNDVLGRYTLSHDPCKEETVWGTMFMSDSLKALLERSKKGQASEVAQAGDSGADVTQIALPEAEEAAALDGGVSDRVNGDDGGFRRLETLQGAGESDDSEGSAGLGGARQLPGDLAEWLEGTPGLHGGGSARRLAGEWATRAMILHKIANPLHLHYLHWRLQHCAIPRADLLDPAAVANAQSSMPSVSALFALPTLGRGAGA
jgi:hypothetical protein